MSHQFKLNYYKTLDNSDLEELSVTKFNSYEDQHFKFIYDRSTHYLSLTGNYMTAIFNCFSEYASNNVNSLPTIVKTFANNVHVFASRCTISSEPHYVYDKELARKQIKQWLQSLDLSNMSLHGYQNYESLINDIIYHTDYETGFDNNEDCMLALAEIDSDVYYGPITWGKIINPVFEIILQALTTDIQQHGNNQKKSKLITFN